MDYLLYTIFGYVSTTLYHLRYIELQAHFYFNNQCITLLFLRLLNTSTITFIPKSTLHCLYFFNYCQLQHLTIWSQQELNCVPMFCVATVAAIFMEINFLAKFGQKEKDQFTVILTYMEYKQIMTFRCAQFGSEFTSVWCLKH